MKVRPASALAAWALCMSASLAAAAAPSAVEQVERDLIQAALDRADGNISESARSLGLTRRGLYLKIKRLGLDARTEEVDTH